MSKHLLSAKIYIYISLIACLMTLAINDQEGNFLLTGFEKKWKFILNDEQNAKILADKLKSEKEIPLTFMLVDKTFSGERDVQCVNQTVHYFNFESSNNKTKFQPYDIIANSNPIGDFIVIFLQNEHYNNDGIKIGKLINGANDPSDLNSAVIGKLAQWDGESSPMETFILSYSDEDESDEVEISDLKISWVIVLLSGTGLLAVGLVVYFILFR